MEIIKADTPNTFIMIVSAEQLVTMAVAWGIASPMEVRQRAKDPHWRGLELPPQTHGAFIAGFQQLSAYIHKHFRKEQEEDGTRQDGRE